MSTSDEWEVFRGRGRRPVGELQVSIQSKGNLSINRAVFEALSKPEAVECLFNREKHQIGIRPANPEEIHAYPVRKQQNAASYIVSFASFLRTYRIPIPTGITRQYEPWIQDGILVINVDHPIAEVPHSARSRNSTHGRTNGNTDRE